MLHELFYCSLASRPMEDADILEILEVSREKNARINVTGILLYYHKTRQFMQILEGEEDVIFELLEVIKNDSRHTSLQLIYHGQINQRAFGNWSMAFTNYDSIDKSKLEGFSKFMEKGFTSELLSEDTSMAIELFQTFKKILPDEFL